MSVVNKKKSRRCVQSSKKGPKGTSMQAPHVHNLPYTFLAFCTVGGRSGRRAQETRVLGLRGSPLSWRQGGAKSQFNQFGGCHVETANHAKENNSGSRKGRVLRCGSCALHALNCQFEPKDLVTATRANQLQRVGFACLALLPTLVWFAWECMALLGYSDDSTWF